MFDFAFEFNSNYRQKKP